MKDKMDIEDLFKEELGSEKVAPSSRSFAQSRLRHFTRKFGLYIIGGTMVATIGVAGLFYSESHKQSQSSDAVATVDSFPISDISKKQNTESNISEAAESTIDYQAENKLSKDNSEATLTAGNVNEIVENGVSSNNQSQNTTSIAKTENEKSQLVVDRENKKIASSLKVQDGQANKKATTEVNNNLKGDEENQSSVGVQNETKESEKGAVASAEVSSKEQLEPGVKKEGEVTKKGGVSEDSNHGTDVVKVHSDQLVQEESKKEIKLDSAIQTLPTTDVIAVEDSTEKSTTIAKKRKRPFKISIGGLYVHQIGGGLYDYSSFFSYSIQSKIKYPLFGDKLQLNTGIDYTSDRHHFYRTRGEEGAFDEVNEIHIFLKRIELPIAVDYKFKTSGPLDYRVGLGLKFSKIFSDEEEALNKDGEIVYHPDPEESFLVDVLAPVLTNKFLYVNVSKDIKKVRTNFQMYYYFNQFQMETYSETFVYDYFSLSSLRVGISVDF